LIKRRSKVARKEEQEGSKEPTEPDQAGQDHHKIKIKQEEKGTRTKPDINFSSSKKFSNKVNNQEQAIVSVLIINKKNSGVAEYSQICIEVLC
jgi:hypothetical protein